MDCCEQQNARIWCSVDQLIHWMGFRESLEERPIFHGEDHGFRLRCSHPVIGAAKEGLEDTSPFSPLSTQPKAMPSVALKAIVYKFRYAQTLEPWTMALGMWKAGSQDLPMVFDYSDVWEYVVGEPSKELEFHFTGGDLFQWCPWEFCAQAISSRSLIVFDGSFVWLFESRFCLLLVSPALIIKMYINIHVYICNIRYIGYLLVHIWYSIYLICNIWYIYI